MFRFIALQLKCLQSEIFSEFIFRINCFVDDDRFAWFIRFLSKLRNITENFKDMEEVIIYFTSP